MAKLRIRGRWFFRWFTFSRKPLSLGQRGERFAARFLKRKRYKIVALGEQWAGVELDIIAVTGRCIVFVEVKTRTSHIAGDPTEAVGSKKQNRLARGAMAFLHFHGLSDSACRFDVISIIWPAGHRKPKIEHIEHAFRANDS